MNNDQPMPRMAMLKHDGQLIIGVLRVMDSDHSLQVIDLAPTASDQAGFATLEMVVTDRVVSFDAMLDKWQELAPSDFWAVVRDRLTKGAQ